MLDVAQRRALERFESGGHVGHLKEEGVGVLLLLVKSEPPQSRVETSFLARWCFRAGGLLGDSGDFGGFGPRPARGVRGIGASRAGLHELRRVRSVAAPSAAGSASGATPCSTGWAARRGRSAFGV